MRLRTDARRNAILAAATEVFREVGFDRASMAMIAARVGGSKTTLYGYFPSKEELFWEAMVGAVQVEQGERALALLDPADRDIAGVLERFAKAYLVLFAAPETIAITRTAIAEGATNKNLSVLFYQRGRKRIVDAIAGYLAKLNKEDLVRGIDTHVAAVHLKGLLDAGILEPLLFGAKPELKLAEAVTSALDAFMCTYTMRRPVGVARRNASGAHKGNRRESPIRGDSGGDR